MGGWIDLERIGFEQFPLLRGCTSQLLHSEDGHDMAGHSDDTGGRNYVVIVKISGT